MRIIAEMVPDEVEPYCKWGNWIPLVVESESLPSAAGVEVEKWNP